MNVYFIIALGSQLRMKRGRAKDVGRRLAELQTGSSDKLTIFVYVQCASDENARHMERMAHSYFRFARLRGEWFRYNKRIGNQVRRWVENNARLEVRWAKC